MFFLPENEAKCSLSELSNILEKTAVLVETPRKHNSVSVGVQSNQQSKSTPYRIVVKTKTKKSIS
jgi:hypothetical protein